MGDPVGGAVRGLVGGASKVADGLNHLGRDVSARRFTPVKPPDGKKVPTVIPEKDTVDGGAVKKGEPVPAEGEGSKTEYIPPQEPAKGTPVYTVPFPKFACFVALKAPIAHQPYTKQGMEKMRASLLNANIFGEAPCDASVRGQLTEIGKIYSGSDTSPEERTKIGGGKGAKHAFRGELREGVAKDCAISITLMNIEEKTGLRSYVGNYSAGVCTKEYIAAEFEAATKLFMQ